MASMVKALGNTVYFTTEHPLWDREDHARLTGVSAPHVFHL